MESRKVKVAMLGPFPPAIGGIVTSVQNFLKSPLKDKYILLSFRTMSKKQGTPEYFEEKVYTKVCRVIFDLSSFLIFLLKEYPQLVHINTSFNTWAFWRDSVYLVISKMFRKKVFFQIRGGKLNEFWNHSSYLIKCVIKQILLMPDLIAVLSSAQKKPFIEIGLGEKVKVFPNTVDLDRFRSPTMRNYRAEFDIPKHHVVILFIANHFYKKKGGMDLLKTIPLVIEKHKKVLFVFVGGGGEEEVMLSFCRKEKIQDYVKFTGFLSSKAIIQILNSSDIFVLPSHSEGFPNVILEAMAAGLPIVSTPVGAIPEIIENGENGLLVKPKDHSALAEKLIWLIENEQVRKKMGIRNIEKIQMNYDLKIVAKIFDESYQKIVSKKNFH